ncbi:flavin reductase family protein [Spirillospora sp. NPDC048911]|uniref:flavin reductase family protein n=1 Tax=Spirillospora sp. NPDC048911 TaxID=3364527 RepID=UPI003722F1F3
MTADELDTVLRRAVRRLATGVAVLTVWQGDDVHGTTVSSVAAISRDPLLVGVCLREGSGLAGLIGDARRFAVNVLSTRQSALAGWFADPSRPRGMAQFDHLEWEPDAFSGAPWIGGSLASLGCHLTATVPAGDHNLLIGKVVTARDGEGGPLLHFTGRLHDGMLRVLPRETTHPHHRGSRHDAFSAAGS